MSGQKSLYEDFRDLLHEIPEIEEALAEWRAYEAVRQGSPEKVEAADRDRRQQQDAWRDLCKKHDAWPGPGTVQ